MIKLISPENNECVSLLTEKQKSFFKDEPARAAIVDYDGFRWYAPEMAGVDMTAPAPVKLSWDDDVPGDGAYLVLIAQNEALESPIIKVTNDKHIDVYNLYIGATYYWCVQREGIRSDLRTFSTSAETPRSIKAEGLVNIRDLGGYSVPGGVVRQGLVYRGCEIENNMHVRAQGLSDFLALGIRTQIDLRLPTEIYQYRILDPFGIKHIPISTAPYMSLFSDEYREKYRRIFGIFADKNAYPIYFHCIAGADRTGSLALMLNAFLGVDMKNLIDDYEFTSLSTWGIRTRNHIHFKEMLEKFGEFRGNTFREQVTDYLLSFLGVTEQQLKCIEDIMLDKS